MAWHNNSKKGSKVVLIIDKKHCINRIQILKMIFSLVLSLNEFDLPHSWGFKSLFSDTLEIIYTHALYHLHEHEPLILLDTLLLLQFCGILELNQWHFKLLFMNKHNGVIWEILGHFKVELLNNRSLKHL